MLTLAIKTVRYRRGAFVATFLAMFFCSLMLISAGGVVETGVRYTVPAQRLTEASVVVSGDGTYTLNTNPIGSLRERVPVDRALIAKLGAVPGVEQAVPDVSFRATVIRNGAPVDVDTWGRNWSSSVLTPYAVTAGVAPARAGEIAVDPAVAQESGIAVGDRVTIGARGATSSYVVTGIATPGVTTSERSLFFSDPDVAALSLDADKVNSVALLTKPGADIDAVVAAATAITVGTPTVVLTGDDRGTAEFPASLEVDDLLLVGSIFVLLSLIAGLLGVASTMSLAFQNRDREIALMRAIGATPGQVRRMILGETLVVSLAATLLSVVPALLLGRFLFDFIVFVGVAPEVLTFKQGWVPTTAAVTIGIISSLGAGWIAGRRAVRTRPTQAIAGSDVAAPPRPSWVRRTVAGLLFLMAGFLVYAAFNLVTGPFIAGPANWSVLAMAVGLMLIGQDVTRLMVRLFSPLLGWFQLPGRLAAINSRARIPQLAAIIGPVMLLTAVATATSYVSATEGASINIYTDAITDDVIMQAPPGGFAPDALAKVRATPSVGAAAEFVTSAGFVVDPPDPRAGEDLQGWQLKGITGDSAAALGTANLTAGSFDDLTGNTVILNDDYSKELGRTVGDVITLKLGDNTQEQVKIVGLMSERNSFATILLPVALLAKHTTDGLPEFLLAKEAPGVDRATLVADLGGVMGSIPGAAIVDRFALRAAFEHHLGSLQLTNYLFLAILVGFISISVVNSLYLATGHRRREFGLERLTGATRSQVIRMMLLEGGLAAGIGVVLGTVISPLAVLPFAIARTGQLLPAGGISIWLLVIGYAVLLTIGASLAASIRALRDKPLLAALPA